VTLPACIEGHPSDLMERLELIAKRTSENTTSALHGSDEVVHTPFGFSASRAVERIARRQHRQRADEQHDPAPRWVGAESEHPGAVNSTFKGKNYKRDRASDDQPFEISDSDATPADASARTEYYSPQPAVVPEVLRGRGIPLYSIPDSDVV